MGALDNEGLDIDGPDNDGPIVTELPRRSCLLCVCRRSRLLLLSAAQLRRLTVRPAVTSRIEICIKKLHMAAQQFVLYYNYLLTVDYLTKPAPSWEFSNFSYNR